MRRISEMIATAKRKRKTDVWRKENTKDFEWIDESRELNKILQAEYAIDLEKTLTRSAAFQNRRFQALSEKYIIDISSNIVQDKGDNITTINATLDNKDFYAIELNFNIDPESIVIKSNNPLLLEYLANTEEFLKIPRLNEFKNKINNGYTPEIPYDFDDAEFVESTMSLFTKNYKFALWSKTFQNKIENSINHALFETKYNLVLKHSIESKFTFSVRKIVDASKTINWMSGTIIPGYFHNKAIQYKIKTNELEEIPLSHANLFIQKVADGLAINTQNSYKAEKYYKINVN